MERRKSPLNLYKATFSSLVFSRLGPCRAPCPGPHVHVLQQLLTTDSQPRRSHTAACTEFTQRPRRTLGSLGLPQTTAPPEIDQLPAAQRRPGYGQRPTEQASSGNNATRRAASDVDDEEEKRFLGPESSHFWAPILNTLNFKVVAVEAGGGA